MKNIILDGVEYTPVIKEEHKRITQTLDFEIYHKDLGKMSWDDAKKACTKLGKEWRLPTRIELILMFETQVCNFYATGYWSSTERAKNDKWYQDFMNGVNSYCNKTNLFYVHPVRDVTTFSLTSGGGTGSTGILNTLNNVNCTTTQDKNVPHTYTNL